MRKHNGSVAVWVILAFVVFCIVAAMMMPCCPEQPYNAKAIAIISDLRQLKTAVLAWYVDNIDSFDKDGTIDGKTVEDLAGIPEYSRRITAYLDSRKPPTLRGKSAGAGEYILACGRNSGEWFVGYNLDGDDERVRQKLPGRAKSVGLLKEPSSESQPYTQDSRRVWLEVMTLTGE